MLLVFIPISGFDPRGALDTLGTRAEVRSGNDCGHGHNHGRNSLVPEPLSHISHQQLPSWLPRAGVAAEQQQDHGCVVVFAAEGYSRPYGILLSK